MTIIVAANLIEGPILASDCRSTNKITKKVSDTATKILPLTANLIVGVAGNPIQAGTLLKNLVSNAHKYGKQILEPQNIKSTIKIVAEQTNIVDINSSRCNLIFAGLDINNKQLVHTDKLKYYLEKENETILDAGEGGLNLMINLMRPEFNGLIEFNFPKSFIYTLSYPENHIREIPLLEFDAWGSGKEFVKNRLNNEFYKLWDLKSVDKAKKIINKCIERGILLDIVNQDVIRLLPPFIISKKSINFGMKEIFEAMYEVENGL